MSLSDTLSFCRSAHCLCRKLTGNIVDSSFLSEDFADSLSLDDQQTESGKKAKKRKTERDAHTDADTEMDKESGKDEKETEETETEGDTETDAEAEIDTGESVEDWLAGADLLEAENEGEQGEQKETEDTETEGTEAETDENATGKAETESHTDKSKTKQKHEPLPPTVMAFAVPPKIEQSLREEAAQLTGLLFECKTQNTQTESDAQSGLGCLASASVSASRTHARAQTCGQWDGVSAPVSLSQFNVAQWQILTANIVTLAEYASTEHLHSFLRALLWPCLRCGGCYAPLFCAVTGQAEPK